MSEVYLKLLMDMRVLYQVCKLVHADLSEYNLLYMDKTLFMIDVSQAVEHDHPNALDFLRRDIRNVNDFFKKKRVHVFKLKPVFEFIAILKIHTGEEKAELERMIEEHDEDEEEDTTFDKIHIHRKLDEIPIENIEKELEKKGIDPGIHHKIAGINFPPVVEKQE